MCKAVSAGGSWTHSGVTANDIRKVFLDEPCLICTLAKRNLSPPVASINHRQWKPGECLCADPVPRISPESYNKDKGFFLFVDMATGYLHTFPTKDDNSSLAYIQAIELVIRFYSTYNLKIKTLRTDKELKLMSEEVEIFLSEQQITVESSAPYAHYQNGAERNIQTVIKGVAAMLHAQPWLRADCWNEALRHYIHIRNHTPNSKTLNVSPWKILTNKDTDLSSTFNFTFGDFVAHGIQKQQRLWKFDVRNELGIYVGQSDTSKHSHRIYDPYKHKVYERTGVYHINISDQQYLKWYNSRLFMREDKLRYNMVKDAFHSFCDPYNEDEEDEETNLEEGGQEREENALLNDQTKSIELIPQKAEVRRFIDEDGREVIEVVTNGNTSVFKHSNSQIEFDTSSSSSHSTMPQTIAVGKAIITHNSRDDPSPTVRQALQGPSADKWTEAIKTEVEQLLKGTLKPVSNLQSPYKFVHTTTQLKAKKNSIDGKISKYKCRICARGDMLAGTLEPWETYSPTINALTFATILQLAIIFKLIMKTNDTIGAYLYQHYPIKEREPLYTKLERTIAIACGLDPDQYYQIMMFLYGLSDAGKAYYVAYSTYLIENGYRRSRMDPCLFTRITEDETTFVMIHVDDTFICSNKTEYIDRFNQILSRKFNITINDNADEYLGIHFKQLKDGSIQMLQPKLLKSLFEEYADQLRGMKSKLIHSPNRAKISNNNNNNNNNNKTTQQPIDSKIYLHLLGSLNYLTRSRPDILANVSFAATKSKNPMLSDYEDLLHILKYVHDTKELSLILKPASNVNNSIQLYCYVDASYLVHPDSKSHTGYSLSFGTTGTFYAKSLKQTQVATSSTHAESRALYTAIQDIIFIIDLCKDIKVNLQLPAIVFEDNEPVVNLSTTNSTGLRKCKHFQMLTAFIREQVENGLISINWIDTNANVADILSKVDIYGQSFQNKAWKLLGKHERQISNQDNTINQESQPQSKSSRSY
jgi:hypothetical protein